MPAPRPPDRGTGESVAGANAAAAPRRSKIPESVLVVIHTPDLQVLLLERADHPGFWQSVTGSKDSPDESLPQTCRREVMEETGIDTVAYRLDDLHLTNRFEIYTHWRHRYADGVTHNTEHVFALEVPAALPVTIAPREHLRYLWLPWKEAAPRCFSWSNVQAIEEVARRRLGLGAGANPPAG
jgi:dihydroneopterin triphosphate diphosphatase